MLPPAERTRLKRIAEAAGMGYFEALRTLEAEVERRRAGRKPRMASRAPEASPSDSPRLSLVAVTDDKPS